MNNLFIITSHFPYEGGEQFLETEILYWNKSEFDNIYILPKSRKGKIRPIPEKINVLNSILINKKLKYLLLSLISPVFYKELQYIVSNKKKKDFVKCLKVALKTTSIVLREVDVLRNTLEPFSNNNINFYCYWNTYTSYAACILKEKGLINKVITRAHGFDLYKERMPYNYMPLKRQFSRIYDKIYLLSDNALKYYKENYKADYKQLEVAKLGVLLPNITADNTPSIAEISILSLSYCVQVKQLDLIMKSITTYASQNLNKTIKWCHIGGGPLYEQLLSESRMLMEKIPNLTIDFIGQLSNSNVRSHLALNYYDLIVNASKSEGIPVSLMEAMSFSIPAVAPDIGGISTLINDNNGYLMPEQVSESDILKGINTIVYTKNVMYRRNAYLHIYKNFNADINYPKFIEKVETLAGKYDTQ